MTCDRNAPEVLLEDALAPLPDARALPFAAYTSGSLYAAECTAIFRDEWVFVGNASEIPDTGSYYALALAGEPIAIVRGHDGELRCVANTCRHRGTPILDPGFGQIERMLICPYHAWAYDLDGKLNAAPFAPKLNREAHNLRQYGLAVWHGLVFVNLSSKPRPFAQRIAGIDDYLGIFEPDSFTESRSGAIEDWACNWKLAVENGIESYHLFKVHAQTLELYTPTREAYYIAGNSEWTLTGGRVIQERSWLERMFTGKYPEAFDHYVLVSLPPSLIGIVSYGSFGWLSAHPTSATTTRIRAGAMTAPGGRESRDEEAFTEAFFAEDKAMCERVQLGMGATQTAGGMLQDIERPVVDFHQFVATRVLRQPTTPLHRAEGGAQFLAFD